MPCTLSFQKCTAFAKVLFLLAPLFLFSGSLEAKDLPGQIIDNAGNVKDVTLSVPFDLLGINPDFMRMQGKIRFYDDAKKLRKVKPVDAKEVRFVYKDKTIRMLSRPANYMMGSTSTKIFLMLELEGKLSLFRYYARSAPTAFPNGPNTSYAIEDYFFQLNDGALYRPLRIAWRKGMMEFLADCPDVVAALKDRDLGESSSVELATLYNEKCGDQKAPTTTP